MTVRQNLEARLISYGMSEEQAKEVMDLCIPMLNSLIPDYHITFDAEAYIYPSISYGLWFQSMKPVALKWIEENKPMAWFKPMFEN